MEEINTMPLSSSAFSSRLLRLVSEVQGDCCVRKPKYSDRKMTSSIFLSLSIALIGGLISSMSILSTIMDIREGKSGFYMNRIHEKVLHMCVFSHAVQLTLPGGTPKVVYTERLRPKEVPFPLLNSQYVIIIRKG